MTRVPLLIASLLLPAQIRHVPGIADVDLALTDGWSSGAGLGLGLSGARRLVDEFELTSKPGTGTSVVVVKWSR